MYARGFKPDKVTYATLIVGFCKEGDLESAFGVRKEMIERGIKLDNVAFTALISGLCRDGNMGFKLLKEMQCDGHEPSVVTYNVLMNGLCKQGQLKNANMLLDAVLNLGVAPDDITYNILLEGHCKHGNSEDFDKLRSEKGLVLDYASYTSLVNKTFKDRQNR
ncbi:hypothetical protein Pint_18527 [Pistacia integerrima]|uniref:Uncharacterized protein n=1 Tax=Pistacia integerrima TaxID=434235 RepID=A0ACC0YWN2_9ROSI|nr:hypothetical protein Pint_18527 [Pistacia integerrima]